MLIVVRLLKEMSKETMYFLEGNYVFLLMLAASASPEWGLSSTETSALAAKERCHNNPAGSGAEPVSTAADPRCGGKPDERVRARGAVYIMAQMSYWNPTRPIMEMQSVLVSDVANQAVANCWKRVFSAQAEVYAMEEKM